MGYFEYMWDVQKVLPLGANVSNVVGICDSSNSHIMLVCFVWNQFPSFSVLTYPQKLLSKCIKEIAI